MEADLTSWRVFVYLNRKRYQAKPPRSNASAIMSTVLLIFDKLLILQFLSAIATTNRLHPLEIRWSDWIIAF